MALLPRAEGDRGHVLENGDTPAPGTGQWDRVWGHSCCHPQLPQPRPRGASPPVLWTINQLKDILIYAHQIGLAGIRLISKCFSAHYFPRKIFS